MYGSKLLSSVVIYAMVLLVCYNWNRWLHEIPDKPKGFIHAVATQDLNMIGEYSSILTNYIYNWIYMTMVIAYHSEKQLDIYQIIVKWNQECNPDDCNYIADGIERARTRFLKDVEEETLQCPIDFDYTVISKTIEFNDYVDHEALICRVREELN